MHTTRLYRTSSQNKIPEKSGSYLLASIDTRIILEVYIHIGYRRIIEIKGYRGFMYNLFSEYFLNSGLELITLGALLFTLGKLAVESSISNDFGKRIPPEKASLSGQRCIRRSV